MKRFRWSRWLILPAVLIAFFLFKRDQRRRSVRAGPIGAAQAAAGDVRYAKCVPLGEHLEGGIFDPSVAYTPDDSVGWLAYSAVTGDHKPIGQYVHTHLARSTDGGKLAIRQCAESRNGRHAHAARPGTVARRVALRGANARV